MKSTKTSKNNSWLVASLFLGILVTTAIPLSVISMTPDSLEVDAAPTVITARSNQTYIDNYYSTIGSGLSGNTLKSSLETLLQNERAASYSYGSLETSSFPYTDVDPTRPNGGYIVSFYSGTPVSGYSGMNKEHTWPNSHGGNMVENDPHVIRPTLISENSSRGNQYYAEESINGWDPDSFGNSKYRGIAARITFYSATIGHSEGLILEDVGRGQDSGTGNRMGKLGDLLKWNLQYPVDQSEIIRNETLDISLNYNRNPFIDDVALPCRIWGDTNENTRNVCSSQTVVLESLSLSPSTASLAIGATQNLTVTALPTGASSAVTWASSNNSIATVTNGVVTAKAEGQATITATSTSNTNIKATMTITVENVTLNSISIKTPATKSTFTLGSVFSYSGLVITAAYSNSTTTNLSTGFVVEGVNTNALGQQTATITYGGKTATYNVTVTNNGAVVSGSSGGYASELFISEYIEGSSYNKAIEIYNGTGSAINLANYSLKLYTNGAITAANTLTLTGTIANNDVCVLAHSSAAAEILAVTDIANTNVINFNGDDSVALFKGETLIDLFGDITSGTDPGTSWTVIDYNGNSVATNDKTFVRHSSIGSPSSTSPFLASQWVSYSLGTHSYLGSHTFAGGSSSGDITNNEQAVAWASYFLDITDETCQAMSGSFGANWTTLASEYNYMAAGSKDAFVGNTPSSATIEAAIERYQLIVSKYGISNFITNGEGVSMLAFDNQLSS